MFTLLYRDIEQVALYRPKEQLFADGPTYKWME